VQPMTVTSNGPSISWTSVMGLTYQLQFKNDLGDTNWNNVPATVAGTGNVVSMTDTNMGTNAARFYRVTATQ